MIDRRKFLTISAAVAVVAVLPEVVTRTTPLWAYRSFDPREELGRLEWLEKTMQEALLRVLEDPRPTRYVDSRVVSA